MRKPLLAITERIGQRRDRNNRGVTHAEPPSFHADTLAGIHIEILELEPPVREFAFFGVTVGKGSLFDPVMIFRHASDGSPVKKELLGRMYIDPCVINARLRVDIQLQPFRLQIECSDP